MLGTFVYKLLCEHTFSRLLVIYLRVKLPCFRVILCFVPFLGGTTIDSDT